MTSLIFGGIVMAHQGVVNHRRGKQRVKNYQRWEDLRDEYDEQKKITRESRSLDLQRTDYFAENERPIMTLRDQQEANDARMSWRPQESWEPSHLSPAETGQLNQRAMSTSSTYWAARGQLKPQKTGATWDDGLPAPLKVSRRSFDDGNYDYNQSVGAHPAQAEAVARHSENHSGNYSGNTSPFAQHQTQAYSHSRPHAPHMATAPAAYHVEPLQHSTPGGPMAELIERGY